MTSDHLTDDVGKLEDRLRTLEQRFAWGVGAAGAIGLIALLSGGFTTYMLNNAEELGGQVAAIEQTVGGIDGTVNQAIGRIEGAQSTAENALASALDRTTAAIDTRQAAAVEGINQKAAEAIDAEWRDALNRLNALEIVIHQAILAFDVQSGCPDGWTDESEAPEILGLDTSGLQPAFDRFIARLGVIQCRYGRDQP